MTTTLMYRYLGTNGVIESPIHLENIYFTNFYVLRADPKKILTDGKMAATTVRISSAEDIAKWKEIDA